MIPNDVDNFIFDKNKAIKELHSAIGILRDRGNNEHYYFGIIVPKRTEIKDKKGKFIKEVQENKLLIIWDDHICFEADKMEYFNFKFTDTPLITFSRWDLGEVKKYIDFSGALSDSYEKDVLISPKELFERIRSLYTKYCYLDDERFYDLHALWDVGTYFFPLFENYPYFELNGLRGTGKTKLMRISQGITFNAQEFVNPTPASIFRFVNMNLPTLYLDECEKVFSKSSKADKDNDDLLQLFNSGWQRGSLVPRLEKDESGKWKIMMFRSYCPKMFGSVRGIPDDIPLKDRSITEIMIKAPKEDRRGDLYPDINDKEFLSIRNALYPFALHYWSEIRAKYYGLDGSSLYPDKKKEFKLSNRDWSIWKPLLSISWLIDEELYYKIGHFAEELTQLKETSGIETDSWDYKIIEALLELVNLAGNEKTEIRVSGIKENMKVAEKEIKPSNTYIGRFLNKIGFGSYRKRTGNKGVYYTLDKVIVERVLITQNIVALPTLLPQVTPEEDVVKDNPKVQEVQDMQQV
jgi:hypothetical protein